MIQGCRPFVVFIIALMLCGQPGVMGAEGQTTAPMSCEEGAEVPPAGFRWHAPIPGCVERPLEDLLMPFDNYNDIIVLTGTGRRVARFGPRKDEWKGVRTIYASPGVHPDQRHIAAVRCVDVPPESGDRVQSGPCAVVEIDLVSTENPKERVLYQAKPGEWPYAPSYSPDGSKVAFYLGAEIVVLNRDSLTPEERIETGIRFLRDPLFSYDWRSVARIFWSGDQNYLLGRLGWYDSESGDDIYIADLRSRACWWVPQGSTSRLQVGPGLRSEAARGPWREAFLATAAIGVQKDLYRNNWGVPTPLGWTPCHRYFWYFYKREGFFAFSAIKYYDTLEQRSRRLKLLGWALYKE